MFNFTLTLIFTICTALLSTTTFAENTKLPCSLERGLKLQKLAEQENNLAEDSLTNEGQATPSAMLASRNSEIHFKQALEQYMCASKAGNHVASLKAASLLGSGFVENVSSTTIEKYLLDAANSGLVDAQVELSGHYCWDKFTGCKNRYKAWYWISKAAENKNPIALNNIGVAYEKGDSVLKNMKLAFNFYKNAADLGYKLGNENACRLLKDGLYVDNTYLSTCK
jgi:TPR repeat protein